MRRTLILAGLVAATVTATLWAKPLPRKDRDPEPMDERTPRVVMETNHGRIVIELNAEKAPISVKNFLQYVDAGHYNGMIFHRSIDKFMIQGGGFVPGMTEKKTRDPIKLEDGNGLSNLRGTIAMARTGDPNSGTAQFFINTVDNQRLDRNGTNPGYAVFGKVVEGMDVVDKISQVPTGTRAGHANVPTQDVLMQSVKRMK